VKELIDDERPWVSPPFATPEGIVGVGGDLRPLTLIRAYSDGVFPWFNAGDPIVWWSPDPRAVFDLVNFHVPSRLAATIRSGKFRTTVDQNFGAVIRGCASERIEGTWITDEMINAYEQLHMLGYAHSLEVWIGEELVGGIYGVAVGGVFAGESMFHRVRDASKVALVALRNHLVGRGYQLFDTQILNDHTQRFGAYEIPRDEYLTRLRQAVKLRISFK